MPADGDIARPRFARMYPRAAEEADRRGARCHRERLLAGLSGTVVEIGAGSGLNFALYPPEVERVVAVEPEPTLRRTAQAAAARVRANIDVSPGTADELPLDEAAADAAVASLVLCSVPDQARALAEIRRVVRHGGELRFYEHVAPRRRLGRLLGGVADATGIWPLLAGGCHLARDTESALAEAGWGIERIERFDFAAGSMTPPLPHILGVARNPAPD